MKKLMAFLVIIAITSGCTVEEEVATTTTTLTTTIPKTTSTIKTTSTGFPRLKPLLGEIMISSDKTFNGTFINAAGYPVRLLSITGQCRFLRYPKYQVAPSSKFEVIGKDCNIFGSAGDRYAILMDMTYIILTPGPVNQYVDHGTLRGTIVEVKNG